MTPIRDPNPDPNPLIDNSQTTVAGYKYGLFGKPVDKLGTLEQPFRHSTKRYDEATGLSYFGYRYYVPTVGRWLTRDPIAEAGGINLYAYVLNNPVNWIDPDGYKRRSIFKWFRKKLKENFDPSSEAIDIVGEIAGYPTYPPLLFCFILFTPRNAGDPNEMWELERMRNPYPYTPLPSPEKFLKDPDDPPVIGPPRCRKCR